MGKQLYNQTDRQIDIDIAKGIGIILVVWAHTGAPASSYIAQFHMPFFFFISGLLYKSNDVPCAEYIKRHCKSLLLPFWQWNFLFFPIFYILYYWGNWSIHDCVKNLAEIALTLNKVPFLGATWFLPALFWISTLMHVYNRKIGDRYRYGSILLLICGGFICMVGFNVTLPYKISRNLICSLFYICGYLYKRHIRSKINNTLKNSIACVCGVAYVWIASNNAVDMGANTYHNKFLFLIGAFAATAFVLRLSGWIMNIVLISGIAKHLAYLGKNSIHIVIWHFLAFRIAIIIQIIVMDIGIEALVAFPVYDTSDFWWIIYLIVGLYGSLFWKYVLDIIPRSFLYNSSIGNSKKVG